MKRLIGLLAVLLLSATTTVAQDAQKADEYNSVREFRNKVFDIQNRDARDIASSVKLLGSGFKGAGLSVNEQLHTITVRDFPENLVAIEEAIKRLDRPVADAPDIELRVSVLIGSKGPLAGAPVPDDLVPVVKQLQSTLRYANYGLMTATMHRTRPGGFLEGSGVAEPTLLGMTAQQERPILYNYRLGRINLGASSERPSIVVEGFEFSMRIPINVGPSGIQYQSVGFQTPVSIRQNEKVVIGTTTMGDKALIVVVTAIIGKSAVAP
jgi:hypothetical protein